MPAYGQVAGKLEVEKQENLFTPVSDYGRLTSHCSHPVKTSNRKTGFYLFQGLIFRNSTVVMNGYNYPPLIKNKHLCIFKILLLP